MFQYFHFGNVLLSDVVEYFPGYEPEYTFDIYANWIEEFRSKTNVFYQSQLAAHYQFAEKEFYKDYGLDPSEPVSYYRYESNVGDAVDGYYQKHGVFMHEMEMNASNSHVEEEYRRCFPNRGMIVTAQELAEDLLFWISQERPSPGFYADFVDSLWFNQTIRADGFNLAYLKSMPYHDYLNTEHWRQVRAAMLLIHRARCQGERCVGCDGAWFGDEKYMHVHHLTYKNRGKERFADLRLLCDDCHKRIHEGAENILSRDVEEMYKLIAEHEDSL